MLATGATENTVVQKTAVVQKPGQKNWDYVIG